MSNKEKESKIKSDLEERFPLAKFSVSIYGNDEVTVDHVGGHDYADEFPDTMDAIREMTKIIRKTIPNFRWVDFTKPDGTIIYARG